MNIEDRLRQVESRIEIQELVARYCFTIDARDIDGIALDLGNRGVVSTAGNPWRWQRLWPSQFLQEFVW